VDQQTVVDLAQRALLVIIYVSAPMLGISIIVGLAISIFQATTQIQEQTLTFVPKILAVFAAAAVFGAWIFRVLIEFTQELFINMNHYLK
jgi:flagellar biosynthesis protein FliQ